MRSCNQWPTSKQIETSVGNIVRKVLKVIREEAAGVNSQIGSGANTPILSAAGNPLHSNVISIPAPSLANLVLLGHSGIQRQQASAGRAPQRPGPSASAGDLGTTGEDTDAAKKAFGMKPALIDAIQEVINELETVYENVAKSAKEYIHPESVF
jgi:translation initiation factor eIF-2B subunit beta